MDEVYLSVFYSCKYEVNLTLFYCTLEIIGWVFLSGLVLQFLSKWKAHRRCVSLPDAMPRRPRLLPPPLPPPTPAPRPRRPRTWHSLPSLLDPTQQHSKLRYDLTISSSHEFSFKYTKQSIFTIIYYDLSPSWICSSFYVYLILDYVEFWITEVYIIGTTVLRGLGNSTIT